MLKRIMLYCAITIFLIGYVLPTYSQSPKDFQYSPTKYGVPEIVGVYITLAVIPAASIPCALEGHLRLILESDTSGVEIFLSKATGLRFSVNYNS